MFSSGLSHGPQQTLIWPTMSVQVSYDLQHQSDPLAEHCRCVSSPVHSWENVQHMLDGYQKWTLYSTRYEAPGIGELLTCPRLNTSRP